MPPGSIRPPVLSSGTRRLLADLWEAFDFQPRSSPAPYVSPRLQPYSSIADVMLGRAVKDHGRTMAAPSQPPSHISNSPPLKNGNVQQQLQRSSSKSIGGFTGFGSHRLHNKPPLQNKSGNAPYSRSNSTNGAAPPFTSSSVSTTASGLHSVFSRQDSFSSTAPSAIDTSDDMTAGKRALTSHHVVYDENDFDDDADIDLNDDYELPASKSMPAPRQPAEKYANPLLHPLKVPNPPPVFQGPTSSLQTWSSSPPEHKVTPPGTVDRRRREQEDSQQQSQPITVDSSQPIRAPIPKRRTLPWAQAKAEEAERNAILEEEEEEEAAASNVSLQASLKKCFRCGSDGHYVADCPSNSKGKNSYAFTPVQKDKKMPWNTTASAIANEKKQFKDTQRQKRKAIDQDIEEMVRKQKKVAMAPLTLSQEQQRVLDLVVNEQKSVFFTGSAGTGKSVLMRAIIAELRRKHAKESDRIAVTASTGLAACNIGGVTLHSFGGIGLGKEDIPNLVKKIKKNAKAKTRWLKTKVLIIDEISMVDGDLFDKLEGIARMMRNNGRPFGGIQLVITGDFFQLPPVPDNDNKARGAKFAFDAGTWPTAVHHTIGLTEVFRQKDPVFANMLNEMRLGKITNETIQAFRKLSRKIEYSDALEATELFPTRNEVENANSYRMRNLVGKEYVFEAVDSGVLEASMRDKLLTNMMAPKTIMLKKGAQVMLIKNMDDTLVNGSLGKVVGFMSEKNFEYYHENPDVLDDSIPSDDLDEETRSRRASLKSAPALTGKLFPCVRFAIADGTYRDLLVMPEEWRVEQPDGSIQAQRVQIPLILAWALSIHKAQGQTLERVKIDLRKIFEKGQAYVALSRATSQAGLEVQNFDKSKVMAHPRVAEFYNSLYSVNKALQHPRVAEPPRRRQAELYGEIFKKNGTKDKNIITIDDDEEEEARHVGYA